MLADLASFYSIADGFQRLQAALDYRALRRNIRGPRVLELGCADGSMTAWLVQDGYSVYAVDGAEEYVEKTRRAVSSVAEGRVQVVQSLFEELKLDQKFNDVLLSNVLHHVVNPTALLKSTLRWLDPSGRLHVIAPNAFSLHRRVGVAMGMLERLHDLTQQNVRMHHRRVFDLSLLQGVLESAGFAIDGVEGVLLKPFSGRQMESLPPELISALDQVGKSFPELCHHLYVVARAA